MPARRSSEKVKTAPSASGDTLTDLPLEEKTSPSHQAYESEGKGGLKSKETPYLTNPTMTPPFQQFSILHLSALRKI